MISNLALGCARHVISMAPKVDLHYILVCSPSTKNMRNSYDRCKVTNPKLKLEIGTTGIWRFSIKIDPNSNELAITQVAPMTHLKTKSWGFKQFYLDNHKYWRIHKCAFHSACSGFGQSHPWGPGQLHVLTSRIQWMPWTHVKALCLILILHNKQRSSSGEVHVSQKVADMESHPQKQHIHGKRTMPHMMPINQKLEQKHTCLHPGPYYKKFSQNFFVGWGYGFLYFNP
jgi:hypothetical protein